MVVTRRRACHKTTWTAVRYTCDRTSIRSYFIQHPKVVFYLSVGHICDLVALFCLVNMCKRQEGCNDAVLIMLMCLFGVFLLVFLLSFIS